MKTFPISSNCQLGLFAPFCRAVVALWTHTRVSLCVYMCANFSYMCTQCAFLGEFLCLCLCLCQCLRLCPSAVRRRRRRQNKLFKWQLNSHKMKTRCLHCSQQLFEFRLFMALKMAARQRVY